MISLKIVKDIYKDVDDVISGKNKEPFKLKRIHNFELEVKNGKKTKKGFI